MTDTLFDDTNTAVDDLDPTKDYITELVGDGKKFKTPQDLARAKLESDRFIAQLTGELAGLRTDLNARISMEELVAEIKAAGSTSPRSEPTNHVDHREDDASKRALTSEEIEQIVSARLAKEQNRTETNRNLQTVRDKLVEEFGQNYSSHLERIASELGVKREYLDNLAKDNPNVFFRVTGVGVRRVDNFSGVPVSQVNSAGAFTTTGGDRDWNYYENLRKTAPKTYWQPKVQNEMFEQAKRLGPKFKP
jgi:hypothetical protein